MNFDKDRLHNDSFMKCLKMENNCLPRATGNMLIFTVIDPGDKETSDWLLCVATFCTTLVLIDLVVHREIMMGNFVKATNQIYYFFHFKQSLQRSKNPLHFCTLFLPFDIVLPVA